MLSPRRSLFHPFSVDHRVETLTGPMLHAPQSGELCASYGKHQAETRPAGPRTFTVSMVKCLDAWVRPFPARALEEPPPSELAQAFPQPRGPSFSLAASPPQGVLHRSSWSVPPARASLGLRLGPSRNVPCLKEQPRQPARDTMRFHFSTGTAMFQHVPPVLFQSQCLGRGAKGFSTFFVLSSFIPRSQVPIPPVLDHPCMRMITASSSTRP
ncbi:hypothetical protein F5883DRAFT_226896 [Diaporthe sp. PMI_573]|jgi:hypothetical protein|nr:hypothetical protein F5883DRAFT_226896 [Diaporthaceae sp. PMI_573]